MTVVLREFGRTGSVGLDAIVGDADSNGVVDLANLTAALAGFGETCGG